MKDGGLKERGCNLTKQGGHCSFRRRGNSLFWGKTGDQRKQKRKADAIEG